MVPGCRCENFVAGVSCRCLNSFVKVCGAGHNEESTHMIMDSPLRKGFCLVVVEEVVCGHLQSAHEGLMSSSNNT